MTPRSSLPALYDRLRCGQSTVAEMAAALGVTRQALHMRLQHFAEKNAFPWPVIVLGGRYVHDPVVLRRLPSGRVVPLDHEPTDTTGG
ncbi:MAG: hypothetical protein AAFV53_35445 [Myxococcota bacterium]